MAGSPSGILGDVASGGARAGRLPDPTSIRRMRRRSAKRAAGGAAAPLREPSAAIAAAVTAACAANPPDEPAGRVGAPAIPAAAGCGGTVVDGAGSGIPLI
jgi:hypothetical protein